MSIDYNKNYLQNLTPTLDYFNNFKNIPKEESIPIIEVSSQGKKEILENELQNGKLIWNEAEFNSWINLLKKNIIIDIKASFNDINDKNSFIIQKNQFRHNNDHPFVIFYNHPKPEEWWINGRLGFIDKGWNFISSMYRDHNISYVPSLQNPIIKNKTNTSETQSIFLMSKPRQNVNPTSATSTEVINHEIHTIKKWEYLWKIISEKYWLKPETDKNIIWQIMEVIRKDSRNNKAIKDIDTIFAWQKLYLPKSVKIKQSKWKSDKEIFML